MKAIYKGIEMDGTPQEILLFIRLMDGPQALHNSLSMTSNNKMEHNFRSESSLAYQSKDKKERLSVQDAAERYSSSSF
ncbi:hypothetical protein [Paenibacillus agricola]|uniref:Uncharacterized protein n=1 Tax=Paenibacillus agricola TaxID=2716264 RepID=A0ABX0JIN4_9BACL|nr:hypothetical protein [Paenibacillus agricola]NHN34314.1 hypothetical protein [Paenibacillus agricola]